MAITNLIPLHPGKDGRMDNAIYHVIGYVENPDKTQNGNLSPGMNAIHTPLPVSLRWIKRNISCAQAACVGAMT